MAIVVGFVDTQNAGGVHGNTDESEDILTVVLPAAELFAHLERAELTYWLKVNAGSCGLATGRKP